MVKAHPRSLAVVKKEMELLMKKSFGTVALLWVAGIFAITLQSYAQSTALPMGSKPIEAANFGFECMRNSPTCGLNGSWIPTISQPGTVRLWDTGTNWGLLNPSKGKYNWSDLDKWLDLIAAHQPRAAMYTFGHVPCWEATVACTNNGFGSGSSWSPSPPTDLTSTGSPSFNAFVKALVSHCSPAGHCVKDYIKYWELWNEANSPYYWSGKVAQLYNLFKPVIPIIRNNVPGAIVSTPPVSGGNTSWMTSWMQQENSNGRLSDYYGFHVYLQDTAPETRMNMVRSMVATKNNNGWTTKPWMNTESAFYSNRYTCSTSYSSAQCQSEVVRWYILQLAYQGGAGGAFQVNWYDWDSLESGGYDTYYHGMMQWLVGATFTASCTNNNTVWSCPLKERNGKTALIVWNTAGKSTYTPPTQYVDYKDLTGTTTSISALEATTIGLFPIMFE